ncbi:MAG: hypothetical protein QXW47_10700 [Candidatus Jordarchaeales archaeon]
MVVIRKFEGVAEFARRVRCLGRVEVGEELGEAWICDGAAFVAI